MSRAPLEGGWTLTIRAILQEIFTALLLAQQPHLFARLQKLQQINLRI